MGQGFFSNARALSTVAIVFFLAAVFKVTGNSVNVVRALQLLIGMGSCGLIFLIARMLFGGKIYNMLQAVMTFKVIWVLTYLLVIGGLALQTDESLQVGDWVKVGDTVLAKLKELKKKQPK